MRAVGLKRQMSSTAWWVNAATTFSRIRCNCAGVSRPLPYPQRRQPHLRVQALHIILQAVCLRVRVQDGQVALLPLAEHGLDAVEGRPSGGGPGSGRRGSGRGR